MAKRKLYGLDHSQEERKEKVIRDIRSTWQQIGEALLSREGYAIFSSAMLFWMVAQPAFWPIPALVILLHYLKRASATKEDCLPMRMPATYDGIDYNNPAPTGGFKKAGGMFYIGNDVYGDGDELWIGKDDILTHMLVLGTTGAGKTETLVSLCFNYLAVGSGFIYVDPKAAPKLGAQIYTMCRILGRDDDFLVINYMADKMAQESMLKHGHTRTPLRQSNTQNPFAVGDANQLTQLLFALMPGDDGGGNSIFQQNAQTLISGLMFVLVEMRNKGERPLSINLIRHYLNNIPDIDALARRENDFSQTAILALQAGLSTVGWDKGKSADKQAKNFPEQYSYARAYFGRALSLLVDNYGRIFKTSHGEVDTVDVITSRRIYVTLIPSMDKDPKELKSLGQICLASVRNACAIGLGDKVQGRMSDVLGALPTESHAPYGIIVDEYAAIETPGFEILLTQGRGLGMAVIVASQDMAGIQRASEAAAEQIVSNCKVKIFMTTEDPNKTYDLISKLAGEAFVLKSSGFSIDKDKGGSDYRDNKSVSADRMHRVDFRDLQKQIEGECNIFFKGELIRGKTFYAAPPLKDEQDVRIAYHLKCQGYTLEDLSTYTEDKDLLDGFLALAEKKEQRIEEAHQEEKIYAVIDVMRKNKQTIGKINRNDIGIAAVYSFMARQEEDEFEEPEDMEDADAQLDNLAAVAIPDDEPEPEEKPAPDRRLHHLALKEKAALARSIEKRIGRKDSQAESAARMVEENLDKAMTPDDALNSMLGEMANEDKKKSA